VITSVDGINWTFGSAGSKTLYAVAWSGSAYVAVGGELSGWIVSSADGQNWTRRDIAGTLPPLYDVVWNGSAFLAVGAEGQTQRSLNGEDWIQGSLGIDRRFFGVAWTGSLFEAVGEDGSVVESADGEGWSARDSGTAGDLYGAVWAGSRLLGLGKGGTILDGGCTAIGRRTLDLAREP
jgi:hypothetical protein